jgi:hypothetical protein
MRLLISDADIMLRYIMPEKEEMIREDGASNLSPA